MKKSRHTSRRNPMGLFPLLLALLGLSTVSCEQPDMYGSPTVDFTVKGKVIDEEGSPIKDLKVVVGGLVYDKDSVFQHYPIETLKTASDGTYRYDSQPQLVYPVTNLRVDVEDVDGNANGGSFESASVTVKDIKYSGGHDWYDSHAEINVPDITLKKKQ